jgi:hypothetical protein
MSASDQWKINDTWQQVNRRAACEYAAYAKMEERRLHGLGDCRGVVSPRCFLKSTGPAPDGFSPKCQRNFRASTPLVKRIGRSRRLQCPAIRGSSTHGRTASRPGFRRSRRHRDADHDRHGQRHVPPLARGTGRAPKNWPLGLSKLSRSRRQRRRSRISRAHDRLARPRL